MPGAGAAPPPAHLSLQSQLPPSRRASYPVDKLVECEVDQAVLQEGPGPAQVIGAVARHMGQAPGRQTGRHVGQVAGVDGDSRPSCQAGGWHQTFMPGVALAVLHPGLSQPLGVGGERGSLLTDDVEFLGDFQVAPGLEGESWMWTKSNGVRGTEAANRDRGKAGW